MFVVGIDLSGPANPADTAVAAFRAEHDRLVLVEAVKGADDHAILSLFRGWASAQQVVAGIDAPLSYNVGGGEEGTMRDAIALAEEISGRELVLERHAPAVGDVKRTRADVAKAEAELGWAPTTSLEDGLRTQWAWVAGRVAAP